MTPTEIVRNYRQLNEGRKRKLVFQLTFRGFASEINNLLSAILYCLEHQIELILYSRGWTAAHRRGWTDYFLPFCRETANPLFYRPCAITAEGWHVQGLDLIQKTLCRNHLNAHDLWPDFCSREFLGKTFSIPELDICGDVFQAKQQILRMMYRLNDEIGNTIQDVQSKRNDPRPYVALHVRRGDKVAPQTKEAEAVALDQYVACIQKTVPHAEDIFLATDDYRVVEEFRRICPSRWRISTFCKPAETGYCNVRFSRESRSVKKRRMEALLLDLHFLVGSQLFIGTYSSNIARLVALFKGRENCRSLDVPHWHPM